jgi:SnoaL-like polyketide cyclase
VSTRANAAVVRRFYNELWNQWRLDLIDELLSPELRFRGSRGSTLTGRDAFRRYVEETRAAFPDCHNQGSTKPGWSATRMPSGRHSSRRATTANPRRRVSSNWTLAQAMAYNE